ncbi:MAG: response regulator [Sphingobacterium sp.]|jgi:ligand-binding sensor domain-containing protein/signal transduction histidine kinase/DNA-binding response OmpR family regulator|uniref:hybrid sensor histidine kinase/response regulator n=1 Tax=Sphingobacterium sp. TaxID=341027 RepID=UPI00284048ED|nr:two-component regulator propeller domain-containing protein [Sphingobacterium sp.]MDR3008350.1 response regulator [Sphingobacterium sp.]
MQKKTVTAILFFILSLFHQVLAQLQTEVNKLLSNSSVKTIYQDSQGYMWFGTFDGLNRYDGHEMKVYRNQLRNNKSIPHNYIYCIAEDRDKNLWVGTGQGVGIYNRNFNSFSRLHFIDSENSQQQYHLNADTRAIEVDRENNVYIGTNGWGLFFKERQKSTAIRIYCPEQGKTAPAGYYHVSALHIDRTDQVWVFINEKGLYRFDRRKKTLQLANASIREATSMTSNDRAELFIGSSAGVFIWDIKSGSIKSHLEKELSSSQVSMLAIENDQKLWIGTQNNGISLMDINTNKVEQFFSSEKSMLPLNSNSIFSVFIDAHNKKWIGTTRGGINIIDDNYHNFNSQRKKLTQHLNLSKQFVRSFGESKGYIWIGTEGNGLYCWDRTKNTYKHFKKDGSQLLDNTVNSIVTDPRGNLWLGTERGIVQYDQKTGFKNYQCITKQGVVNENVQVLLKDEEGEIWAATFSNGHLYKYHFDKDRFEVFDEWLNDLNCLLDDKKGQLWAGNYHEIIKINKKTKAVRRYNIDKPIRALYIDRKGSFWIGTEGRGLLKFDQKTEKISASYSTDDGLNNNSVLNILEDQSGNLWLSTFNGLSKFNPKTKRFTRYETSDGLQSNEFSYGAALKTKDNSLLFGGNNGFDLFQPDSIKVNVNIPNLVLTSIKIDNQPLNDTIHQVIIGEDNLIKKIILPYHKSTFSLDYSALEFSSPQKIRYRYFMDGLDKDWNDAGTSQSINYNNLREGSYVLHLQSTDTGGNWSAKEIRLAIEVLPPWYRTWWAYLLYILVFGTLIYRYRLYNIQKATLDREIQHTRFNAQKERELNEKRYTFFTHVSHEFRTPLTLIINPLKKIINEHNYSHHDDSLKPVYRNAKRLLSLVDQLLIFRKTEDGATQIQETHFDLQSFTKEVYLYFTAQAKLQQINYKLESEEELIYVVADKEKIEIILCNLISNAFKFTPDHGSILLRLHRQNQDVVIQVQDSGSGISSHIGDQIFDKYFSNSAAGQKQRSGFGIGMFLVKNFVEMHHGTITYKSSSKNGTLFTIKLPIAVEQEKDYSLFSNEDGPKLLQDLFHTTAVDHILSPPISLRPITTQKASILFVDDDIQLRNYLYNLFKEEYLIHLASNGTEAIEIIRHKQLDLIISDLIMDEMDGLSLCKTVKSDSQFNHIPFILLTSSTSDVNQLVGIQSGADDYILKPFDADILRVKIQTLLRNRKNLQEFFFQAITLQSNELKISAQDKTLIERCIQEIEAHLLEDFNVKNLADNIGMSHSALYKRIKMISGKSLNGFIRSVRLKKAAELLILSDLKVNEVVHRVGFDDIKYFREQFNKLFGLNPSAYIKKYRKAFQHDYRIERD